MTTGVLLIALALVVAWANGANDNFKGVATLMGSGTTNYRGALIWATIATFAGSITAVVLAGQLIKVFGGKGLVPDEIVSQPEYLTAVAIGSSLTILLATWLGMPVSTTHSLVGGLVGAGMIAGGLINVPVLAWKFLGPLLISPLLAVVATVVLHRMFRFARLRLKVSEETCFCVGTEPEPVSVKPDLSGAMAIVEASRLTASLGTEVTCQRRYQGNVAGINASTFLNSLHYLSAGAVSFARGLNDTPKIAALMIAGAGLSSFWGATGVGIMIAIGGLIAARRVAETMSQKITPMNAGQGFTANLVTGLIVIVASRWGVPVSTTHVSCGGIFGVGAVTAEARWPMIARILVAWLLTLPLAGIVAGVSYSVLAM